MSDGFDYVVVGAGSAGCVLAARLSEAAGCRILLLEAGGTAWNPMLSIPLASGKLLRGGLHGWKYTSMPGRHINGRRIAVPRGKVVGGCSSINGMVYVRGAPSDYDAWAAGGNAGWRFADVLPYFLRSEEHIDRRNTFHGSGGPLKVSLARSPNPLYQAFIDAGGTAGYPVTDDFNGAEPLGFGRYDFTIVRGRRSSAATAFLSPALHRTNLELKTKAQVLRLLFDGRRVRGVTFRHGGRIHEVTARREVILCGGVYNSSQLLLVSGIGPAEAIRQLGIDLVHDLPGVGLNMQDHVDVPVRFSCNQPVTLHSLTRIDRAAIAMAQAALLRSGPATSFPTEAGAFLKTAPDLPDHDMQIHFSLTLGGSRVRMPLLWKFRHDPVEQEGFQIRMCVSRPHSRGRVFLTSPDPTRAPGIDPNFLSERYDVEQLIKGVGIARRLADQPSLKAFVGGELTPGDALSDPAALEEYVRNEASSVYHPVGTCRMGSDAAAVVDAQLKVRGIDGLRVADASIMPTLVGGNTLAAVYMIAEKAADLVMGRAPPAPFDPRSVSKNGHATATTGQ